MIITALYLYPLSFLEKMKKRDEKEEMIQKRILRKEEVNKE